MSVTLHTNLGDLKIELFCEDTPVAAYNFLALCASGYYNNTEFHRNIPGFMIQGGDPTGTGKGGESIYGKPFNDEFNDSITHNDRGIVQNIDFIYYGNHVVSMANKGSNTNGSQFFITYAQVEHLNSRYTAFGKVISGKHDTLTKMEKVPVGDKDRPLQPIRLNRITIHANPLAQKS